MKLTLNTSTSPQTLTTKDLKPGEIGVVIDGPCSGVIVMATWRNNPDDGVNGGALVALSDAGVTWSYGAILGPVRKLKPGETLTVEA